ASRWRCSTAPRARPRRMAMAETRRRSFRTAYRLVAAAIVAALVTAACGQKGPLYLPDKGGEVVTRPAGATQSTPQQQQPQQQQQPPQQPSPQSAPQPSSTTPESTTTKPDEKKNPPPR